MRYVPRVFTCNHRVLYLQAGLPPGVLNFLSISRENSPKLVAELIGHPYIRHLNVRIIKFSCIES